MAGSGMLTGDRLNDLCEEIWQVILTDSLPELENKLNNHPAAHIIDACKLVSCVLDQGTLLHRLVESSKHLVNSVSLLSTLLTFLRENERYHDEYNGILLIGDGEDGTTKDSYIGYTVLNEAMHSGCADIVRAILYSIPEEDDRVILLNRQLSYDEKWTEYSTALHNVDKDSLKICLESVSSQEDRLHMLLEYHDQCAQVIHQWVQDPDMLSDILENILPEETHWLTLLSCENNNGQNCLHAAVSNRYYKSVDLLIRTLNSSVKGKQNLTKLVVSGAYNNLRCGETLAFDVRSEEAFPYITRMMDILDLNEKVKFLTAQHNRETVFHKFTRRPDNLAFLNYYMDALPYPTLLQLLQKKAGSGMTALHEAASAGNTQALKLVYSMLKQEDWNSLMTTLVYDNESGGILVRNEWRLRPSDDDEIYQKRSNNHSEINRRKDSAASNKLPPPSDSYRGDTPLCYAVINLHKEAVQFILESLDTDTVKHLYSIEDIYGVKLDSSSYSQHTVNCIY